MGDLWYRPMKSVPVDFNAEDAVDAEMKEWIFRSLARPRRKKLWLRVLCVLRVNFPI